MFVIENGLNEGEGDRMSFEKQLKRELFLYGAILIFLATIALTLGLYYYRSSSSDNILKDKKQISLRLLKQYLIILSKKIIKGMQAIVII